MYYKGADGEWCGAIQHQAEWKGGGRERGKGD